jgi:hypothetical protein
MMRTTLARGFAGHLIENDAIGCDLGVDERSGDPKHGCFAVRGKFFICGPPSGGQSLL